MGKESQKAKVKGQKSKGRAKEGHRITSYNVCYTKLLRTWLKCQSITSDNSSHVIFSLPNCDQTADPGTVRSHFDCKEPAAVLVGQSGQPFFVIGHRLFGKDLSVLVCHTDVVFLIPEVDADYRSVLFCFHRGRQDPRPLARPQLLLFPSSLHDSGPRRCREVARAASITS